MTPKEWTYKHKRENPGHNPDWGCNFVHCKDCYPKRHGNVSIKEVVGQYNVTGLEFEPLR